MRSSGFLLVLIGLVATGIAAADEPTAEPTRTRRQFAEAINKIKEGMAQEQVVSLLGRPDDVRTQYDSGGHWSGVAMDFWCYGTSGHLTPATLGQVCIDDNQRVQYVFGKGTPPSDDLFQEDDLRELLRALDEVPSYNAGWKYNPRKVIRAVNLLQPLGKRRALAAIQEYLRIASHYSGLDHGRKGVFLVLRVLFEVPQDPGYMPRMGVGAPYPPEPKDKKLLPRFPIVIRDDIPFIVVNGYSGSGEPQRPESHLTHFRKHGTLRSKPLVPTDKPFAALEKFAASYDEARRNMLGEQILRLLDSVYRVEPEIHNNLLPFYDIDAEEKRNKIVREVSALRIRWDTKLSQYSFLDGSSLPPVERKLYRRAIWKPNVPSLDLQITVERYQRRYVDIEHIEQYKAEVPKGPARIRVFDVTSKENSLVEFEAGRLHAGEGISAGYTVELDDGAEMQLELTVGGKSHLSPIFKP
jgi:hypothetical protein